MGSFPVNANICEVNGPYYPVKLTWLPRVDDLIDLRSHSEQTDGGQPSRHYKVVQVVHRIREFAEKASPSHGGFHFVEIYVAPAESPHFGRSA
jgi:hypothetical protein